MDIPTTGPELFSDAFSASPIGIAIETLEGQPLFVNPALCNMLGYTEAEMKSKHCVEFSPPEDSQKDWELFQQLRAGSITSYQLEKRYFRGNGTLMWGKLSLSLLKGRTPPLVIAMVEDITEQKSTQDALKEQTAFLQTREELLSNFVKNVPVGVAMFDREMRYLQVSDRWCEDYGVSSSLILGRSHYELNPDLPSKWKEMHRRGLEGETLRGEEDRWDRESGTMWIRWEIRPWWGLGGVPGGILLIAEDITQRKQMQEELSDVARKLVEAQEKERARIARDLHDDISQRMAVLSMGIEQLRTHPSEIDHRGLELRSLMDEILADIQSLSTDLHPSKLEYLGAVGGMKSWSNEFAQRHKLAVDFTSNVRSTLPSEIGVTFFRVLQEALQNTVKHSGGKRVRVQLREDAGALKLIIRDSGRGFDPEAESRDRGLGLTSMRERIRLVNGEFSITSKLNGGTTIEASVPLKPERKKLTRK